LEEQEDDRAKEDHSVSPQWLTSQKKPSGCRYQLYDEEL